MNCGYCPDSRGRCYWPFIVMPLQSVTFEGETDIRCEFQLETSDEKPRFWCILVAKFSGHYRPGHLGAPDALFIQGITQTALGVWRPPAFILSFRHLSYTSPP